MSTKNPAALRADRKNRLANLSVESQSYKPEVTEPKAPVAQPVETPSAVTELVANVLDPKDVDKAATFEMHLFNEGSDDPHWMLTADGRPIAEIRLSDQEDPKKIATVFCDSKYAKSIITVASQTELSELLRAVKARPYVAKLDASEAMQRVRSEIKAEVEGERRKALASMKADFVNMLNLVVAAQTKNFISDNVLKDALFSNMKRAGISDDRAVSIIESAFQEKSAEYHDQLFAQASKWSDLSAEALSEIREQIGEMPVRTPSVQPAESLPVVASAKNNVPFKTYTQGASGMEPEVSVHDHVKSKLGLGRRTGK